MESENSTADRKAAYKRRLKELESEMNSVFQDMEDLNKSHEEDSELTFEGRLFVDSSASQDDSSDTRAEFQFKVDPMCPDKVLILDSKSMTDSKINYSNYNVPQKINTPHCILDVINHEKSTEKRAEPEESETVHENFESDEACIYLGDNPSNDTEDLILLESIANRLKSWTKKGIGKKEIKEELLSSIPRKGAVNLEAPILNEEVLVDIHPKSLIRDEFFRDYQNLTGAALASSSLVLSMILNDSQNPLEREDVLKKLSDTVKLLSELFFSLTTARKTFLLGRYEERVQKILKKVEPSALLFGDNLRSLIESSKAMERVSKELKPKQKYQSKPSTSSNLNWRSSTIRREVGRGSHSYNRQRTTTSKPSGMPISFKQRTPAKRYYTQSQPQQRSQRH
ncbi:uncharacterized protein LOC122513029 [Leptopilina heterotoma]|uniref:uncharacterized protein LOC122513029 n=1 Tax=Leptopilina heterotoma TaxID=63436 RepID=UPI001CA9D4B2|nr:uncharacterized protein LOC122513029 [Leptopilina heterotoma]